VFVMDVTNQESVRKGLDFVKSRLPPGQGLWGLVNNAGVLGSRNGPPEFCELSEYRDVMEVNVFGLIDVTMTFLPLVKAAQGRVINMSSLYGRMAVSCATQYSMSKYAVEGFSDSLRRSLRPFKVSVHLIEPGVFTTDLSSPETMMNITDHAWKTVSQETRDEFGEEYLKNLKKFAYNVTAIPFGNRMSHVTDTVVQALFSRYPRARYVVGNDANYAFIPVTQLPEWISDWIIDMVGGCPVPAVMKKRKRQKHE